MLRELSDIERGSLRDLLAHPTPLRSAIEKFSSARKQAMDSSAAECLRTLPRQFEEAADYAAKAEVYLQFLKDLERFAEK